MQSHATLTMKHDVAVAVASTVVAPAVVIETNAFRAIMTRSSAHIFLVCVWPAMSGSGSHTHTQLLLLVSTSFKLCQSALQFQCDTGALPTITFNSLWVVAATAGPFAQTQNNKSRYARTLRSMNAILALEFLCFWCYKLHVVWPMHFHSPH